MLLRLLLRLQRNPDQHQGRGIFFDKICVAGKKPRLGGLVLPVVGHESRLVPIGSIRGGNHPPFVIEHQQTPIILELVPDEVQIAADFPQMRRQLFFLLFFLPLLFAAGRGTARRTVFAQIFPNDKRVGKNAQIVIPLLEPEIYFTFGNTDGIEQLLFDFLGCYPAGHVKPEPAHPERRAQGNQHGKDQNPIAN